MAEAAESRFASQKQNQSRWQMTKGRKNSPVAKGNCWERQAVGWNGTGAVCGQRHSGVPDIPWAPARTQSQRAPQRPVVLLVSPGLPRPDLNFRSPEKAKGLPHPRLLARPHLCGQRVTQ